MTDYGDMPAECVHCHRTLSTYVPKKGDGSTRYFRTHKCAGGVLTSRVEVPNWAVSAPRGARPGAGFQTRTLK